MATSAATSVFHPRLPALVIDVSPYWRPPELGQAVVVADALVGGKPATSSSTHLSGTPAAAQFPLRALLFRAITDLLHRPHEEPDTVTHPYLPALEVDLGFARTARRRSRIGHSVDRRVQ